MSYLSRRNRKFHRIGAEQSMKCQILYIQTNRKFYYFLFILWIFYSYTVKPLITHYISTVLSFLVSVKQRRGPKRQARPITHYHAYRKLYITDTSVFRTRSAAVVLATVLANEIFLLQTTFGCLYNICNNCVILC